ncbi:MAG: hypothetical protein NWQ38_09150 [Cellulophaga sp.]|nr:hypothetical protein [Cellulophaga sp.]
MKKDTIDNLFDNLKGSFDIESPAEGHELRFLAKLKPENGVKSISNKKKYTYLSIAASVLVIFGLGFVFLNANPSLDKQVVKISPEISKTEFYFANVIQLEINKLQNENTPATKKIIDDTMLQLTKLESDYGKLENDLINGGNSKFILSAMITNFQTRIDLLADVLEQIDEIKKIQHEKAII